MKTKSYVSLAGSCVDIDAQSSNAALSLEKRDVGMGLSIFLRDTQIEPMRKEDQTFFRNRKLVDFVMKLRIQDVVLVHGKMASEVDIVGI